MPIVLPSTIKAEIERPHGTQPLLWLLELEVDQGGPGVPPLILPLCDGKAPIVWPVGNPTTQTWYPFPFTFSPIEQTQEGDLVSIDLTIDNSTGMLMRWLHDGNGLEGNRATLWLVPTSGLAIAYPNHEFRGPLQLEVASAGANADAVTFRLAMPNWFNVSSPNERYVGEVCKHQFGSGECGYVINSFAAFSRCSKLLGACVVRGDDLVARGLPAVLPGNFGGHPGISRRRA